MFVPRWFIAAGIALVAMSLGAAGHGLWWLVGLVFAFGHWGRWERHACGPRSRRTVDRATEGDSPAPATTPDPSHDAHEAFPAR